MSEFLDVVDMAHRAYLIQEFEHSFKKSEKEKMNVLSCLVFFWFAFPLLRNSTVYCMMNIVKVIMILVLLHFHFFVKAVL